VVDPPGQAAELDTRRAEIVRLGTEVERLQARIAELEAPSSTPVEAAPIAAVPTTLFETVGTPNAFPEVTDGSAREAKVQLFRSLFVGRDDVYALRWENKKTGKRGWGPASKNGWRHDSDIRDLLALTDDVVTGHLRGLITVGLYPLMSGDTCRLLACDFDGPGWELDARAYWDVCEASGVPAALERSRSGNGAHVWTFFETPVSAASARAVGAALLREAMALRVELDLASYDRLFPSQDYLPAGKSFGNLIALPLQRECRRRGTTVFIDPGTLEPWPDQWAFLSSVRRMSTRAVEDLRTALRPTAVGPDEVRYRRIRGERRHGDKKPPPYIHGVRGAMVGIERAGLPPSMVADLKHLAAVHNPEFYRREQQRRSTWKIPRLIRCYQEDLEYLWLPRGLAEHAARLVADAGSHLELYGTLRDPPAADHQFDGVLSDLQHEAVTELAKHRLGVLVAPTGAGKTVMACALIAHHRMPTLIIVDRQQLADQWRTQLTILLGLTGRQVGQLGGGRHRRSHVVDLGMFQSIARRVDDPDVFDGYGLVVIDECHHVPAESYERALRHVAVPRWLGLTATPQREDSLHPLITMQCGPIRHTVPAGPGPLVLRVVTHATRADRQVAVDAPYQDHVTGLAVDDERNRAIATDVTAAIGRRRPCLVLTQRTEHLDRLIALLTEAGHEVYALRGGMGKHQRTAVTGVIAAHPSNQPILIAATGPYAGEGFDCPRIDTLFLTLPIRSRTRLTQYVGRIMRDHPGKVDIEVHDYDDTLIPMFRRSRAARLATYGHLGFDVGARS
jgi:superfamily II DNA or RNA helicase